MGDTVMLALPVKRDVPDGWLTEAIYKTGFDYLNRGLMNECEVTLRYGLRGGALDVVAFERMLWHTLQDRETTVEDLALTIASQLALVCKDWFQVQLVAEVPRAPAKLTVIVKRSRG
jgi:hypothetical protein